MTLSGQGAGGISLPEGRRPALRRSIAWCAVFFLLAGILQCLTAFPLEDDTAYHFSVARLMRTHGLLYSFPWTPFSWQFDHYADKEFFFHLLFMPLAGTDFNSASRILGTVLAGLTLCSLYRILRGEGVKDAGIWTLVPMASTAYLWRIALVRPHLVSISLALVVLWSFHRGRLRILFVAALLYPLCYVAFWQIPLLLLVASAAAGFAAGERIRVKVYGALCAGLLAGVVLHPHTWNLLQLSWIHMSQILLRNAWIRKLEFGLGTEFNPVPLAGWGGSLLVASAMTLASLYIGWRKRRESSLPLAFALAALFFAALSSLSMRFVEYFVPFAAGAAALSAGCTNRVRAGAVLLALSVLYMPLTGLPLYRSLMSEEPLLKRDTARLFSDSIPEGAQVFTCGWDYTGTLMLALPERRFIVAADPTLFYVRDPKTFEVWGRMPVEAPPDSADIVRRVFRSRYVLSRNFREYGAFFDLLETDPQVRLLYSDERWVLYDMGG